MVETGPHLPSSNYHNWILSPICFPKPFASVHFVHVRSAGVCIVVQSGLHVTNNNCYTKSQVLSVSKQTTSVQFVHHR